MDELAASSPPEGSQTSIALPEGATERVVATLPAALSPSRASDFMTCPLLFRFRVIDRLPEQPSTAALRGTMVHAVLERLFDLPRGDRTLAAAASMLRPAWDRLVGASPELAELFAEAGETGSGEDFAAWLAGAEKLLDTYFRLEDPNRLEPARRELYVAAPINDPSGEVLLRGYVDRLDIAPDGAMRVVDYKTGRAPGPAYEAKALFQMKFYALVLWKLRGVVPRRLQLLYLGNGEVLRYDPDENDLLAIERKLAALWSAIRSAASSGTWQANPSKLCGWCDHRPRCPAHGGTPPPVPVVNIVRAQRGGRRQSDPDPAEQPLF